MTPSDVLLINPDTLPYQPRVDTIGAVSMAFCQPFDAAQTVHTGIVMWDQAQAPAKTLDYDEYLLVLTGSFGVTLDDARSVMASAGQVLFIPKGTTVQYHGRQAKVFFAISTPDSALARLCQKHGAMARICRSRCDTQRDS